jgi:hypothetical protein
MSRRETGHFVYRLIPPRPSFHLDMSDEERAIPNEHVTSWEEQTSAGKVVVYGPRRDRERELGTGRFHRGGRRSGEAGPRRRSGHLLGSGHR